MSALVDRLQEGVTTALRDALRGERKVAMVDFPRHRNVGDSAIWLGERAVLDRLGVTVAATTDKLSYSPRALRRRLGDRGVVLIHGGGNFGDLYPVHQQLRERVFADFRDRPIVQLPQSINFGDPAALERTRRLIADHGDVTLIVRDRTSEAFATEHFEATVVFAPDAAFGLGVLRRPVAPEVDVARQARTDKELAGDGGVPAGSFDWLGAPSGAERRHELALEAAMALTSGGRGRTVPGSTRAQLAVYDRYARWNLGRGTRMLARGRTVVTDRLHGHVLCVLMDIPHVVVNDRYGKIEAFWDAWSHEAPRARFARSASDVPAVV
jgi:pyruvyl transferase EpsO